MSVTLEDVIYSKLEIHLKNIRHIFNVQQVNKQKDFIKKEENNKIEDVKTTTLHQFFGKNNTKSDLNSFFNKSHIDRQENLNLSCIYNNINLNLINKESIIISSKSVLSSKTLEIFQVLKNKPNNIESIIKSTVILPNSDDVNEQLKKEAQKTIFYGYFCEGLINVNNDFELCNSIIENSMSKTQINKSSHLIQDFSYVHSSGKVVGAYFNLKSGTDFLTSKLKSTTNKQVLKIFASCLQYIINYFDYESESCYFLKDIDFNSALIQEKPNWLLDDIDFLSKSFKIQENKKDKLFNLKNYENYIFEDKEEKTKQIIDPFLDQLDENLKTLQYLVYKTFCFLFGLNDQDFPGYHYSDVIDKVLNSKFSSVKLIGTLAKYLNFILNKDKKIINNTQTNRENEKDKNNIYGTYYNNNYKSDLGLDEEVNNLINNYDTKIEKDANNNNNTKDNYYTMKEPVQNTNTTNPVNEQTFNENFIKVEDQMIENNFANGKKMTLKEGISYYYLKFQSVKAFIKQLIIISQMEEFEEIIRYYNINSQLNYNDFNFRKSNEITFTIQTIEQKSINILYNSDFQDLHLVSKNNFNYASEEAHQGPKPIKNLSYTGQKLYGNSGEKYSKDETFEINLNSAYNKLTLSKKFVEDSNKQSYVNNLNNSNFIKYSNIKDNKFVKLVADKVNNFEIIYQPKKHLFLKEMESLYKESCLEFTRAEDLSSQENYEEALELYNSAYLKKRECLGEEDVETALALCSKAGLELKLHLFDESIEDFRKVLVTYIKEYGPDHLQIATIYHNIGIILDINNNFERALECFKKALRIKILNLGENAYSVGTTVYSIGGVYESLKNYEEALNYYSQTLEIYKNSIGEISLDIASVYNSIALVFDQLNNKDESVEAYNICINICNQLFSKPHTLTATAYNNLGLVCFKSTQYNKAIEYFTKAIAIREELLEIKYNKAVNQELASSYNNLAGVYYKKLDFSKASSAYEMSLTLIGYYDDKESNIFNIFKYPYNDKNDKNRKKIIIQNLDLFSEASSTLNNLGLVCVRLNLKKQAVVYFQKCLNIRIELYGKYHSEVGATIINLAGVLLELSDNSDSSSEVNEAIENYTNALLIYEKLYGTEAKELISIYSNLGHCYRTLSKKKETFHCYKKALDLCLINLSPESVKIAEIFEYLSGFYEDVKDYIKAKSYLQKSLAIKEKRKENLIKKDTQELYNTEVEKVNTGNVANIGNAEGAQISLLEDQDNKFKDKLVVVTQNINDIKDRIRVYNNKIWLDQEQEQELVNKLNEDSKDRELLYNKIEVDINEKLSNDEVNRHDLEANDFKNIQNYNLSKEKSNSNNTLISQSKLKNKNSNNKIASPVNNRLLIG